MPAGGPADAECLQQLFPPPSANYESPIQLGADPPEYWPSDDEIRELWDTPEADERARKFHSIPVLTKYIRSKPLLCAADVDGWRIKDQHLFIRSGI